MQREIAPRSAASAGSEPSVNTGLIPNEWVHAFPTAGKTWLAQKAPNVFFDYEQDARYGALFDNGGRPNDETLRFTIKEILSDVAPGLVLLVNYWDPAQLGLSLSRQLGPRVLVDPLVAFTRAQARHDEGSDFLTLEMLTSWVQDAKDKAVLDRKNVMVLKKDQYLADVINQWLGARSSSSTVEGLES